MTRIDYSKPREIRRAIAIKQYRYLLKLAKLAEERSLYAIALDYRTEATAIKAAANL